MVFGTTVGLQLGLLFLCMEMVSDATYRVWYCGGTGIRLIAVVYGEGLRSDLWCLLLPWDWIWAYCCCVIRRV